MVERSIEALQDSDVLQRATLAAMSDAVFLCDDVGAFTFVPPNVDVIFGYVPQEVREMGTIQRLLGNNLFDRSELVTKGELHNIEREIISKSGEERMLLIHLKRVDIEGGTVLYSCRDVTALRAVERELAAARHNLAHAGRLMLVGQLARSIIHDLHQPITGMRLSAHAARSVLERLDASADVEQLRDFFDHVHQAGIAASEIIARMRRLMRKHPIDLQPIDLNDVVGNVADLVRTEARRHEVELRVSLAPYLPPVRADRTALKQVVLQLMTNAIEAMHRTEGERMLTAETHARNHGADIIISDTGPGIPEEHASKLFDDFFTTKPDGVGLGLSIVRTIVHDHGGDIVLANVIGGHGASFRVRLPADAVALEQVGQA
jgi:PAS domain S-box-containing protein